MKQPEPAVVRTWHDEAGWGVVDSPAVPGGCWVHWSRVAVDGYRSLAPGAAVQLEWEAAAQDGFAFRAVRVWPAGEQPAEDRTETAGEDGAYASTLVLTVDAAPTHLTGFPPGAFTSRTGYPEDAREVLRLWAATFPATPAPDLRTALAEGRVVVLEPLSGGPLGGAAVVGPVADHPGDRRLTVLTDRPDRWAAVASAAARCLREEGVDRWHVTVREDDVLAVATLEAAGYELTTRSWGASLFTADVDADALRAFVDAAARDGAVVRHLTADDASAVHGLVRACRADFPATPATPAPDPSPQDARDAVAGERAAAFGAFVPSPAGERLVAVTALRLTAPDDGQGAASAADTDLTAVAADHRRRGLATAVKAFAVLELSGAGVQTFSTGGAQVNEGSLRANQRLGYRVEPLWLTWTTSSVIPGPCP